MIVLKDADNSSINDHIISVTQLNECEIKVVTSTVTQTYTYDNKSYLNEDLKVLNKSKSQVLYS